MSKVFKICFIIRNPIKKFSGEDLIIELQKLNPFGYREEKAMSPPEEKLTLDGRKRLEILNIPKKVEKVQIRYENIIT